MPGGPLRTAVRQIKRVLAAPAGEGGSDRQLLQRFSRERDEAAFACLVRRHAALVLGVSRRVLGHVQDAEDVFQASFLILARNAGSRRWQPSVAGWLHRVAYRLALRARARIVRQRGLERQAGAVCLEKTARENRTEWYIALDEELQRLGEQYRGPLVLCYLEGKTRDQAAGQLGWSLRTLERRLEQGLKLLRAQLIRRGLELPAALLTAGLSQQSASAATSPVLATTIQAAVAFSSGAMPANILSNNVVALTQGGLKAMAATKLKIGLALVLAAGVLAVGLGGLVHRLAAMEQATRVQAAAHKPATTPETTWPEGTTVTGRILNSQGEAVANAEVLLLGTERIMVEGERKTWFVFEGEKSGRPPSVRTNARGEFRIQRSKGNADRLAVISADPLLWVVARKSLPHGNNLEIKLPPSGNLSIHCDLPGKAAKLPVLLNLRTFGVEWDSDSLRFNEVDDSLLNPGDTVFKHLPPGIYAVEWDQQVPTGNDGVGMNLSDRQLVKVESSKTAVIRFQRKLGRPLSGQVRGLEKVDLRYATLSISYAGPEERDRSGRAYHRMTGFECISINSDGHFKTDPIPPGKYILDVFAVRSSTPRQSYQNADFRAQMAFTVPESGPVPELVIVARPNNDPRPPLTDCRVRVVDEAGKPLGKSQLMLHTADAGYHNWTDNGFGIATFPDPEPFARTEVVDVLLRADGYASAVARFERNQRDQLRKGQPAVILKRGQKVELRFRLPEGLTWPQGVPPDAYFQELEARVQMMRQPANRKQRSDFNMLNLHETGAGRFELRLAPETPPFFVGIHAPGFLQYFDTGPFTLADFKQGVLTIDVPRPASLDVRFDPGSKNEEALPFKAVSLSVMRQVEGDSYLDVASDLAASTKHELRLTDLSPGHYYVRVGTQPRSEQGKVPGTEIDRGSYQDRRELDLEAGKFGQVRFGYVPFDPNAYRGQRTAVLRIRRPDDTPAKGRRLEVGYFDGHYGSLTVFSGPVPDSGEITLKGITDRVTFARGSYSVTVDNHQLGRFDFTKDLPSEIFEFHLPPRAGDLAPEVELQRLATGKVTRLSELRGKVVCLEFCATWCGPCQSAMAKLNHLAQEQTASWKDRVVLLPVSIDVNGERPRSHVGQRGWEHLEHHWAGKGATVGWDAPAARAFVVRGVPETILIGRDGRILWRGHPGDTSGGQDLRSRIEAALAR
jgi:RNA polymerase sigma factor (sigma-70 family)